MNQSGYGRSMEGSSQGSVRRARERALTGEVPPPRPPKHDTPRGESPQGQLSPPPRRHMPPSNMSNQDSTFYWAQPAQRPAPQLPAKAPAREAKQRAPPAIDARGGQTISRPTQAPHWPLPPSGPPHRGQAESGRGQNRLAPPRPQRPSRIPSMVDQSRPQEPTPVFLHPYEYHDDQRESIVSHGPSTNDTNASSRLTTSSVGTIPEFPVPTASSIHNYSQSLAVPPAMPSTPHRRSVSLGHPPTSRRGASSYYSTTSNVSPIPEESLRAAESYASSFAMPLKWDAGSPIPSPNYTGDSYYDDLPSAKSRDSFDSGEEMKLVRSASIGKKGKASLINTKPLNVQPQPLRPGPKPLPGGFNSGTGYTDASTSSSEHTLPHKFPQVIAKPTGTESNGLGFADAPPMPELTRAEDELPPSRIPVNNEESSSAQASNSRRPPKLDIDAVRKAEARGSLTSLPDLIKRATRLVAMIDTGKRPASRFDNLSDFLEKPDNNDVQDRHQSGLSDMLNAFPPPASRNGRRSRGSWFRTTSWPLVPGRQGGGDGAEGTRSKEVMDDPAIETRTRAARKCCGMPPWVFILVVILLLCVIAVAIVIPLQFFVFKTLGNHDEPQSSLEQCRSDLTCQNGGTNVISQGSCSCICTNGFGGSDCSEAGSASCTTTNLESSDSDSSIENVTIGRALPRLIADASGNFSIPLSGTAILAKINSGDISCLRQNALVTFAGRSTRLGEANTEVEDMGDGSGTLELDDALELSEDSGTDRTLSDDGLNAASRTVARRVEKRTTVTATDDLSIPEPTSGSDGDNSDDVRNISPSYNVTERALDFARIAVLYVLQEQSVTDASNAQTKLERFFNQASISDPQVDVISEEDARNVTIGGTNTVDLVNYFVNIGDGLIGGNE